MSRYKNLRKASFNATNLNGVAAISLSIGMGSITGSLLFASAVAVGTYIKYKNLKGEVVTDEAKQRNILQRIANDPSLTAKILMAAAGLNCLDATADIFLQDETKLVENITRAVAWGFGVLGDDALRRLDKINFKDLVERPAAKASKLKSAFKAATSNPAIFYNATNIAFLTNMMQETSLTSPEGLFGAAIAGTFALGIGHSLRRTFQATKGVIHPDKINDGPLNILSAAGITGQSLFAASTGHYYVAGAQVIFAGSAIKSLFETRASLRKTGVTQPAELKNDI